MMMSHALHRIPLNLPQTTFLGDEMIKDFLEQLRTQRWDDHRYYHHSRINQSLHFVSAASFLIGYVMIFFDPVILSLIHI